MLEGWMSGPFGFDTLCIMQDDEEDWDFEARRMGREQGDSSFEIDTSRNGYSWDGLIGLV